MDPRHPRVWLMTDERMADVRAAVRRLPPGAGIVFRHYATPVRERFALFLAIRRIARARRLTLVTARGRMPGADGVHGPGAGGGLRTWPVHDRREAVAARRAKANLVFVSPIHPTRSHPGAPALGRMRAAMFAHGPATAIALGGMDRRRWLRLRTSGFHGWAAIDALTPRQKRKAVPT